MGLSTQKRKHRVRQLAITKTFKPKWWDDVDGRFKARKRIVKLYKRLVRDSGADNIQKDLLCQRAAFMAVQVETMESHAMEEGKIDDGVHTQAVNCLIGLLVKLGLNAKSNGKQPDLKAYVGSAG